MHTTNPFGDGTFLKFWYSSQHWLWFFEVYTGCNILNGNFVLQSFMTGLKVRLWLGYFWNWSKSEYKYIETIHISVIKHLFCASYDFGAGILGPLNYKIQIKRKGK